MDSVPFYVQQTMVVGTRPYVFVHGVRCRRYVLLMHCSKAAGLHGHNRLGDHMIS
jgi:hypothetical protein